MCKDKQDWRDKWGYYHTPQSCRVCGNTHNIGLEPRYGYPVCETHSTTAPADMPKTVLQVKS